VRPTHPISDRFRTSIAVLAVLAAAACCLSSRGGDGMAEVASRNETRLLVPGIHEVGDFVFGTARTDVPADATGLSRQIAGERAEMEALAVIVRGRSAMVSVPEGLPDRLRSACAVAAARCSGVSRAAVSGARLVIERDLDGGVVRVIGVPKPAFDAIHATPVDLRACLAAEAEKCGLSAGDALLLLEIAGGGAAERQAWDVVRPCLARKFGPGIAMMSGGTWDVGSAADASAATEMWAPSLAAALLDGGGIAKGAQPLDAAALASFGPDELLAFAGHRANDPALRAALLERLPAMGFARSAALLGGPGCAVAVPADLPGSRLESVVRAKVITVPVVALALLSGGTGGWAPSGVLDPALAEAAESAVRDGDPGKAGAAIAALADGLSRSPDPRGLVSLGRALLAVGDPGLAVPAFAAASRAAPSEASAAIGLLQALRSLGKRDEVRARLAAFKDAPLPMDVVQRDALAEVERWSAGGG
jgi:hypothetical protein